MHLSKSIVSIIAIFFSVAFSHAQQYKTALLFDAKGDIESINTSSDSELFKREIKFNRDGMMPWSVMTYQDSLPIGFNMELGNHYNRLKVDYNENKMPSSISLESNLSKKDVIITVEYIYDEHNLISQIIRFSENGVSKLSVRNYSNWIYDDRHNWIQRLVEESISDSDNSKNTVKNYYETRKIKYY